MDIRVARQAEAKSEILNKLSAEKVALTKRIIEDVAGRLKAAGIEDQNVIRNKTIEELRSRGLQDIDLLSMVVGNQAGRGKKVSGGGGKTEKGSGVKKVKEKAESKRGKNERAIISSHGEIMKRFSELIDTLEVGNNSASVKNEAAAILDKLYKDKIISKKTVNELFTKYLA